MYDTYVGTINHHIDQCIKIIALHYLMRFKQKLKIDKYNRMALPKVDITS